MLGGHEKGMIHSCKRLTSLATAVFTCYLIQAYIQELILQLKEVRRFPNYFTLAQSIAFTVFAYFHIQVTTRANPDQKSVYDSYKPHSKPTLTQYAFVSVLTTSTVGLSNIAVANLNYVTHLMFKSCKLIPVMIGSMIIVGRRYKFLNVLACLCMTTGLVFFTYVDSRVYPEYNSRGIVFVCLALCADAVVGNYQELMFKRYSITNAEMVFYSFGIGSIYMLLILIISGDLLPALKIWNEHPVETYAYCVLFSLCGYMGIFCVYSLVREFGALLAATVTTCRKMTNVVLSFLLFPKPFSSGYVFAGLLVLIGIVMDACARNRIHLTLFIRTQLFRRKASRLNGEYIV